MEQQLDSPAHGKKNGSSPKPSGPEPYETTTDAPFSITVRFADGMGDAHANAFKQAADRWTRVISGGLSPVTVDGEIIEGLLILVEVANLDGTGGDLAEAHPTHFRPLEAPLGPGLPAKGEMLFDRADLDRLAQNGLLVDVITHEMGHVIGFGTNAWLGFVQEAQGGDARFHGRSAMREYATLLGSGVAEPVPVDAGAHWRESIMGNELMTGAIFGAGNPLSALTVSSLEDLGYEVDYRGAEAYALPSSPRAATTTATRRSTRTARCRSCNSRPPWAARILPKSALTTR
jgi:hypothetical protein